MNPYDLDPNGYLPLIRDIRRALAPLLRKFRRLQGNDPGCNEATCNA